MGDDEKPADFDPKALEERLKTGVFRGIEIDEPFSIVKEADGGAVVQFAFGVHGMTQAGTMAIRLTPHALLLLRTALNTEQFDRGEPIRCQTQHTAN